MLDDRGAGGSSKPPKAGAAAKMTTLRQESDAKFRAAMSMFAGPDAAQRVDEAVGLVEAAAKEGHPEAIERRALFECSGLGRAVDWEKALNSLADAAELGSQRAARQLVLLAENRLEAAPTAARAGFWKQTRSRISIARRLQPPPSSGGRMLSADPFVRAISGMCSAVECQWLIAAAQPWLERATLHNKGVAEARTNEYAVLNVLRTDLIVEMVRARIANEIGAPLPCLEVSQVLRYAPGEEFLPHYDFLHPLVNHEEIERFGQRSATVLIYLNEDFEGGETRFLQLGIDHRGMTGDAIVFGNLGPGRMPDPRTQHAGLPPSSGVKWLFSQWIRDRYTA